MLTVAEIDVDRAGRQALVADRAVVGHVRKFVPVPEADAAPRLLLVQECLDQQRSREDLVARRIEQVRTRHVRRAHRFALAATQAVLDRVRDRLDVALLHDQRLVAHQPEAGRVGVRQVRAGQQLPLVEAALGIDGILVAAEVGSLVVGQELELGDADTVLAGDHAVEIARDLHDARHRGVGPLQHRVVVGIDRDVGVHVAVAGMHVQRDEHAAAQHFLVDRFALCQHGRECGAREDPLQRCANLGLPRHADRVVLQQVDDAQAGALVELAGQVREAELVQLRQRRCQRSVEVRQQPLPAAACVRDQLARLLGAVADDLRTRQAVDLKRHRTCPARTARRGRRRARPATRACSRSTTRCSGARWRRCTRPSAATE